MENIHIQDASKLALKIFQIYLSAVKIKKNKIPLQHLNSKKKGGGEENGQLHVLIW